jgi:hypothetical protein
VNERDAYAMARPGMGKREVATGLPAVTKPRGRRLNCQAQMQQSAATALPGIDLRNPSLSA